jgi:hypothetical protein
MTDELAFVLKESARLATETADALTRGDTKKAAHLQRQAELAWQKARRLGQRRVQRPVLSKIPSMRERAIEAVMQLNVPSSPKLIAAYCEARTGDPFDLRAIASIRRDEQRSWKSGSRRDTYLVPALEGPWLAAARGRFALSHWPLSIRIVGPLSPRTDHLRVCLRTVDQLEGASTNPEEAKRLRKLLAEYARTVPGAMVNAWDLPDELDLARVRAAVKSELDVLQPEDDSWRQREAQRAARTLSDVQQIWGGEMPHVVKRS